ncbi:hypothetical protein [Clostridium senegalense]|uniref:hypothetical protein n=1 Tax=Clostridium senegalense TaxID=1465809 RepID=UPI000287DE8D|nr:hypothetical protein [Clostridium senegalense]
MIACLVDIESLKKIDNGQLTFDNDGGNWTTSFFELDGVNSKFMMLNQTKLDSGFVAVTNGTGSNGLDP